MILGDPLYIGLLISATFFFYSLPPGRWRSLFIFLVSYAYYLTFSWAFFPVLLTVTFIAFGCGVLLARLNESPARPKVAVASIVACLSPLAFYKYLIPLVSSAAIHKSANWDLTMAQLLAPIGISFYTFAAVGYLIDVTLKLIPAERNFIRMATFCNFFPYVTMGPIPRITTVMGQLSFHRAFTADRAIEGLTEILIGATMKLWIADALAGPSTAVYSDLANCAPLEKLVATFLFSFQLYADFAGYSLIAIGSARLFGVDLPANFRQPYLSTTIAEFWHRWHISLLSWLRDYVFTPLRLQWRRSPRLGTSLAMFITLLVVGVWHGAGWGFVVFGLVHGVLLTVSQFTLPQRNRLWASCRIPPALLGFIRVPITFSLVSLTMVLFRAQDLTQAFSIYHSIFSLPLLENIYDLLRWQTTPTSNFAHLHIEKNIIDLALIGCLILGDLFARWKKSGGFIKLPALVKAPLYATCVLTILYQGISIHATKPFVYFQF